MNEYHQLLKQVKAAYPTADNKRQKQIFQKHWDQIRVNGGTHKKAVLHKKKYNETMAKLQNIILKKNGSMLKFWAKVTEKKDDHEKSKGGDG